MASSATKSWPWRGVNALNAVIQLFVALDAMRQHVRPDARLHGIIVKGGEQPNIIPEYTRADFYLRALDRDYCGELLRRGPLPPPRAPPPPRKPLAPPPGAPLPRPAPPQ